MGLFLHQKHEEQQTPHTWQNNNNLAKLLCSILNEYKSKGNLKQSHLHTKTTWTIIATNQTLTLYIYTQNNIST